MAYLLSLGTINVLAPGKTAGEDDCVCNHVQAGCMPAYVFSVSGQVNFRNSLQHLAGCNSRECRRLNKHVYWGMVDKLTWLMEEHVLLGCVQMQPLIYGSKKLTCKRKEFPVIAHHLAHCHRESCAQLRRAILLTVRDQLRNNHLNAIAK